MLLDFLTRCYRTLVEISCWIMLIAGAVVMGILFEDAFYFDGRVFLGGLIGLIIVFNFELTFIVPFMLLFEVNNNIEEMDNKVRKIQTRVDELVNLKRNSKSSSDSTSKISKPSDDNSIYVHEKNWICKKCGETNPNGAVLCRSCGR